MWKELLFNNIVESVVNAYLQHLHEGDRAVYVYLSSPFILKF